MELAFENEDLRSICESRRRAINQLGAEAVDVLEQFLADIDACESVAELVDLYPDEFEMHRPERLTFNLGSEHQLVFRSGHVSTPTEASGKVRWGKVSRVRVEAIEVVK